MGKVKKILSDTRFRILFILLCVILIIAVSKYAFRITPTVNKETINQISTLNSLMAGNYDGIDTVASLKKSGDIGIGTFDGLDGELVMLDGKVYQAKASGEVNIVPDTIKIPFSAGTFFDKDIHAQLTETNNMDSLKVQLDNLIKEKDAFYAIRVDGIFSHVKVRSVPKQEKPYKVLSEVTKNQPTFEYKDVKGTIVGFWSPDYIGGVNVPGYHLHFISEDRTKGGHLLEISMISGDVTLDITRQFSMNLGGKNNSNSQGAVTKEEIKKVEQ